jgi:hypothetical protein
LNDASLSFPQFAGSEDARTDAGGSWLRISGLTTGGQSPPPIRVDDQAAMRNMQQNKRMRGRNNNNNNNNNRKNHNPLTRVFESNGPDVKIRGTASHVAEKYIQLARDAQASGDPVGAENYYQHAEHYFRLIAAAQEQLRQNQPQQFNNRPEISAGNDSRDGNNFDDEGDEEISVPESGSEQPAFGTRDPQPFVPRDAQFYGQNNEQPHRGGPMHQHTSSPREEHGGLPSFITGGGGQQPAPQENGQGGYENNGNGGERFHNDRQGFRRRRRHRGGYRNDQQNASAGHDDGGDPS